MYHMQNESFYEIISIYQKEHQKGEFNSQYGKCWFTNRNTGECKPFKEQPEDCWVKGRNLFKGQFCVIKVKKQTCITNTMKMSKLNQKLLREKDEM